MTQDRNQAVDVVRAVALIGIAVVNLPFMAQPMETMLVAPAAAMDRVALYLVELVFQAKFFLLFSFVFGWGMEIQIQAAQRAGASFARRFSRRLAMLALFGALHAVLVFSGDILLLYAMLGLITWAVRGATSRRLLLIAGGMIPVAALSLMVLAVLFAEIPLPPAHPNLGGSYTETVLTRWRDWPQTFFFLLLFQGHLAFAAFLAGIVAARNGLFESGNALAKNLRRKVLPLLVLGLTINALYVASGAFGEASPVLSSLGFCSLALGGPILATAYLGLILSLSDRVRFPRFFLLAGRNSLSCYVTQGLLAGLLFGGYGLGLFGTLGNLTLLALSFAVTILAMLPVVAFASRFGHGPLELLLRKVTYG
jgi:uncharacterized protein